VWRLRQLDKKNKKIASCNFAATCMNVDTNERTFDAALKMCSKQQHRYSHTDVARLQVIAADDLQKAAAKKWARKKDFYAKNRGGRSGVMHVEFIKAHLPLLPHTHA